MKKTIKELADELGVKKHIIKYQVDKLTEEYVEKKSGILYVKTSGILIIKGILGEENSVEKSNNYANNSEESSLVQHLLKEVDEKNSQIKEFQKLFETQQKLLDQQQQLTLQANKKIEQLELSLTEEVEEEEIVPTKKEVSDISSDKVDVREEGSLTFFQRLFGKRK